MLRRLLFSVGMVLAAGTPLRAQSLVEASKRAQEASAANKSYTPTFTNSTLSSADPITLTEASFWELTMDRLRNMVKTIKDVEKAYVADKDLAERMATMTAWSRSIAETERGYIREPALGAILKARNLTARQYIVTQFAFQLALAANNDPRVATAFARRGTVSANAALLRANQAEVDSLAKQIDPSLAK